MVTTGALLEAMVRHRVRRIVYASSNHAVGRTPRSAHVGVEVSGRPDTFYGVGKVAAEALLRLYADRHGIDAVSTRIGSFGPKPTSRRQLSTWLSQDDAVRMFHAALTATAPGYAVLYGISDEHARVVGPRTRPGAGLLPGGRRREFATDIEALAQTEDDAEAHLVGGPFATSELRATSLRLMRLRRLRQAPLRWSAWLPLHSGTPPHTPSETCRRSATRPLTSPSSPTT